MSKDKIVSPLPVILGHGASGVHDPRDHGETESEELKQQRRIEGQAERRPCA
jgi:hypothetical protein